MVELFRSMIPIFPMKFMLEENDIPTQMNDFDQLNKIKDCITQNRRIF